MALAIELSGILIPTVFFFLNTLGNDLLPGNIKVYGPGKALLRSLYVGVSICFT